MKVSRGVRQALYSVISAVIISAMVLTYTLRQDEVRKPEPASDARFEVLETFPFLDNGNGWPGNIIRDKVTGECYLYSRYRMANAPCPEKKETKLAKSLDK